MDSVDKEHEPVKCSDSLKLNNEEHTSSSTTAHCTTINNEDCSNTGNTSSTITSSSMEEELRGRLHRRNILLDTLREAYHRDVVVIKECLHKAQLLDPTSLKQLQTIPSTDIRPVLDLFAPAQCELRCIPCRYCGGTLEIVHKECETFQRLSQALKQTQDRQFHLQAKVRRKCCRSEN